MKKILLGALIIFIIGEIVIFYDSRQIEMQISQKGVLSSYENNNQEMGAQVWLGNQVAGVHCLNYKNNCERKVCLNDPVTLVIIEKVQYLYYGICTEDDIKNDDFKRRGGLYFMQVLVVLLLVIFFSKK